MQPSSVSRLPRRSGGRGAVLIVMLSALAPVLGLAFDGPPPPWVPEGYTILSFQEQDRLLHSGQGTQLGAIIKRNAEVLDAALATMTKADLEELVAKMKEYQAAALAPELKIYTQLVWVKARERVRLLESRPAGDFTAILKAQEESTGGFPNDLQAVTDEAERIAKLIGSRPTPELYLAVLKPLRARPWNVDARHVLSRILSQDDPSILMDRERFLTLRLAALEFVHRRQAEQPEQGSWYSLEADILSAGPVTDFVKLRPLWERAIALHARDYESYSMDVILARLAGDAAREAAAIARNKEVQKLDDEAIEYNVRYCAEAYLPSDLRERLYEWHKSLPAAQVDWAARLEMLRATGNSVKMLAESTEVLRLSDQALPQPYRAEFLSLNLVERTYDSRGGGCDAVAHDMKALEEQASAAYPARDDPNMPPPPHQVADLGQVRQEAVEMKAALGSFDTMAAAGKGPDGEALTAEERRQLAEMKQAMTARVREVEEMLAKGDDQAVLAAWNRRDRESWTASHALKRGAAKVLPLTRAEELVFPVRAALASCYTALGRYDDAVAEVDGCVRPRPMVDSPCAVALDNVGMALAEHGHVKAARSVYQKLLSADVNPDLTHSLEQVIDRAAAAPPH